MKYKKSTFLYFYEDEKNKDYYVVNTFYRKLLKLNKSLFQFLKENEVFKKEDFIKLKFNEKIFKKLIENKNLIKENLDELNSIKIENKKKPRKFNSLHLVPTNSCNFDCEYCFVKKGMLRNKQNLVLSFEKAKEIIDYFFEKLPYNKNDLCITFYGGEPLLRSEFIFKCINYIKKYDNNFRKKIITNGSLVTKNIAKTLFKNDCDIGISIDGKENAHNKKRYYRNGKGTFKDVLNGYEKLKKEGNRISILCTVGNHNIKKLEEHIEFILKLKPHSIAINSLMGLENEENEKMVLDKYEKCLDLSYKYGIEERYFIDFVYAFLKTHIVDKSCSACGHQIVVSPEGKIGPCPVYLRDETEFCEPPKDINKNLIFSTWNNISTLNMKECKKCPLIPMCGGGCVYDRKVKKNDFLKSDEFFCEKNKRMMDYLIKKKINNESLFYKS